MENEKSNPTSNTDRTECKDPISNADLDLVKKVHQTLQGDSLINSDQIKVHVSGRTVYLEGIVTSEKQRNLAYEAVMNIFGVRNVVNYLTFPCPYLNGGLASPNRKAEHPSN